MIELERAFFDEMVEHGLAAFPNEACGVLAGKEGRPVKFFAMANADASPASYRLDPREQLDAANEIEDEDWQTMGIFHTHTHTEAYPSPTDQDRAFWPLIGSEPRMAMFPDAYYLIMSLSDRANPDLRAFRIHEIGRVDEEEVAIG
jgi:[CysO sulfur-carrier protein]-S-L-cysteine hydrolase